MFAVIRPSSLHLSNIECIIIGSSCEANGDRESLEGGVPLSSPYDVPTRAQSEVIRSAVDCIGCFHRLTEAIRERLQHRFDAALLSTKENGGSPEVRDGVSFLLNATSWSWWEVLKARIVMSEAGSGSGVGLAGVDDAEAGPEAAVLSAVQSKGAAVQSTGEEASGSEAGRTC